MPGSAPALVMVAGPNGSGKTTLIEALRASSEINFPTLYINADELQRARNVDSPTAQRLATAARLEAIAQGKNLMYETVMSHPSKIAELQAAARMGYTTTVIFIATDNAQVNVERVALRVASGGHDVPRDRIRARHRRSIALAPTALAFAEHAYIYDNTAWGTGDAQQLQAVLNGPALQPMVPHPARWVTDLIEKCNGRTVELQGLDLSALTVPNLFESAAEGPITASGKYYVLQSDRAANITLIHDRALLTKTLTLRHSYRIEYAQGVSKITRRPSARIRAVKTARK